ncbi:MAG: hypothetical protein J6P15_05685, partial [Fibrobacter sp.]|nr:hypothetical protein [Fibrobacter sp.]
MKKSSSLRKNLKENATDWQNKRYIRIALLNISLVLRIRYENDEKNYVCRLRFVGCLFLCSQEGQV